MFLTDYYSQKLCFMNMNVLFNKYTKWLELSTEKNGNSLFRRFTINKGNVKI